MQTNENTKVELGATPMAMEVAEGFGIPSRQLIKLIKHQIIAVPEGDPAATDAELALVLSVIRKSGLDPMTGQIHAWRDWKGKMAISIGYDGWVEYANRQSTYLRTTYEYGPISNSPDGKGKECWEWIKATIWDSVRGEIPQVPIFLEEWYVPQRKSAAPWQKQTKHKLQIVTCRHAQREVYGMTGVVIDEDASYYRGPGQGAMTDAKTEAMAAGEAIHDGVYNKLPSAITDADLEDEMVEAVEGPDVPVEEPAMVDEQDIATTGKPSTTPLLDAMEGPECAVPLCKTAGTCKCGSCGEWFCVSHMSEDPERCNVCFRGGE